MQVKFVFYTALIIMLSLIPRHCTVPVGIYSKAKSMQEQILLSEAVTYIFKLSFLSID